jgi:hypothetical protein
MPGLVQTLSELTEKRPHKALKQHHTALLLRDALGGGKGVWNGHVRIRARLKHII